ncbi:thiol peroxidase [Sulfurospirillum barnesii]|uniref:Thiol peroxidase n=1 Tax=Sulfurospirillum barnesii (strain ATCC 700032 / DSM 10660 / SES-3) TaxID=760154 RepID=I3XZ22_SULBS|nr:thiol peroxidase [Sulfurospirillum barnesii]AFL69196.1 peroxiredoxin [Sulfurospirillum barnesii SES-3]
MATTKLKGNLVTLTGKELNVGDSAPSVTVVAKDLSEISVGGKSDKAQLIVIVPSLDTAVCAQETRTFNTKAAAMSEARVVVVSMDLPFAMGRFCTTEGIENLQVGSDFRARALAEAYGVLIQDGPLQGLSARAIFIVDTHGKIAYKEICPEITEEPNYEAALCALESLTGKKGCGCHTK